MGRTHVKLPDIYIISARSLVPILEELVIFPPAVVLGHSYWARARVRVVVRVIASPARQPGQTTRADGESSERQQDRNAVILLPFKMKGLWKLESWWSRRVATVVQYSNMAARARKKKIVENVFFSGFDRKS